jgi:putative membrane protein
LANVRYKIKIRLPSYCIKTSISTMFTGRSFRITGAIRWSFKAIILCFIISTIPVLLYQFADWTWMKIPWLPVSTIAIAVAFYLGFKNSASYDRTWEARKIWGAIVNTSRSYTIMVKDFVTNEFAQDPISPEELHEIHRELVFRHVAWLTALRHQLRRMKPWEHARNRDNRTRKMFSPESNIKMEKELQPYVTEKELERYMKAKNAATQILGKQSERFKELKAHGLIDSFRHVELQAMLTDMFTQQGKSERIKNFPFPRQYASLNFFFVVIFVLMMPFGLMHELEEFGRAYVWLTIPMTMIIGWVFFMMELVGDYSENPFEGLVNDIPITSMSRSIEADILELIDEKASFPPVYKYSDNIMM